MIKFDRHWYTIKKKTETKTFDKLCSVLNCRLENIADVSED